MSAAAVIVPAAPEPVLALADPAAAAGADVDASVPMEDALAAHAAVLWATEDLDAVDQSALASVLAAIADRTKDVVSHDTMLAHLLLLATFHQQMRDGENEAKDLAFLCAAEARYLAYMDALAKAVAKDASLVENPPLPPLDVAMFWHSHMLSPLRYADDVQRRYGPAMIRIAFPMMRLSKAMMGATQDNLDAHAFWAAHVAADLPYELSPAAVDEASMTGKVACPSCRTEQSLATPKYAAFRLHGQQHACTSCATSFTAEHVAVRKFLAHVARAPHAASIASTQLHPKTHLLASKLRANVEDLYKLFDKGAWAQHAATLPALPTWADIEAVVMAPIVTAAADSLALPGNQRRFALVLAAHRDVTTGPWSMDLVRAVRRQRRFSAKMFDHVVRAGCATAHRTLATALVQYPKFLAMAAIMRSGKAGASLVPTSTIDLAWHTHQLTPAVYAMQTCALVGRVVNHNDSDDTESEARIATGAKAMPDMWRSVYGEDYWSPNVLAAAGKPKDAANCQEACGVWDAAAGKPKDAANCQEACGVWDAAAGKPKDAANCQEACGVWDAAAGKPKDAANCQEACGVWDAAAGKPKDAANCQEACGVWDAAAGKPKDAANCQEACGVWDAAASMAKDAANAFCDGH